VLAQVAGSIHINSSVSDRWAEAPTRSRGFGRRPEIGTIRGALTGSWFPFPFSGAELRGLCDGCDVNPPSSHVWRTVAFPADGGPVRSLNAEHMGCYRTRKSMHACKNSEDDSPGGPILISVERMRIVDRFHIGKSLHVKRIKKTREMLRGTHASL
jgi:hypothetical protein